MRRRTLGLIAIAASIVGGAVAWAAYDRDLDAVRARTIAGSRLATTSHGLVEYAIEGEGPPVLVLHGAGGGYDHGLLIARIYGGGGFRWIVPSRFGYLRSPLPPDASTAAQADAAAELLDRLGVERVAVLAMSGGVPPALQFAARHPQRTEALVLLSSAPYTPLTAAEQDLPIPAWLYAALFSSDLPYWALQRLIPSRLAPLFDVRPDLALTPEEAAAVDELVHGFQPVTWRVDGLANEGAAIDPAAEYDLAAIRAPTLVVHARDDGINPFRFGEHTAEHVPGAELVAYDTGGHMLLGHWPDVRAATRAFLRRHPR